MTSSYMWIPIQYESDNDAAKASSDTGKTLCARITALFGYS